MSREYPIEKTRNIGIIAHIDAGKTTITERILLYTGKKHKIGEVHEGKAEMDWMEQEQERGITITSAATSCFWSVGSRLENKEPKAPKGADKHRINIIDTPGHIDFTVEVQRSLRVLDGAVVIFDGKMGVEPQSETVWRQADEYKVPRICFINKINLIGGDFYKSLGSIQERLSKNAFPIFLPLGQGENTRGIVDLITQKAYEYVDSEGIEIKGCDIPEELKEDVKKYHEEMIEKIVEIDDELAEKYLEGSEIEQDKIKAALRKGVVQGKFFPVLGGDGRKGIVQILLDSVLEYLPSPIDLPPIRGLDIKDDKKEIIRKSDDQEPFSALAFKVATDPYVGQLTYFRIYSGVLEAGSYVLNTCTNNKERVGRIVRMHANSREEVKQVFSGDIAAIVGLKKTTTGDTLCDPENPIVLENIKFPEPVISIAVEPKSKTDQEKLSLALHRLAEEDPTFRVRGDEETGETIISGMGELHLEIIVDRMFHEFSVEARVGKPRVAYKETITKEAFAEGKYIRQSGGRGQYGHVWLKVEPLKKKEEEDSDESACAKATADKHFEFINAIKGGSIPQEFIPAVSKGVQEAVSSGVVGGYPMVDIQVTLYDGSFHDVDSSEAAFKIAGSMAFKSATKMAGPVLLEPIMSLQIVVPEKFMGDATGDISSKRGIIQGMENRGELKVISAQVPLASMFGYATEIRSLSQGRASFTMEFSHYAEVPRNISEEIVGAKKEEGDKK